MESKKSVHHYSLVELRKLKKLKEINTEPFIRMYPGDGYLLVRDNDPSTDYRFDVKGYEMKENMMMFHISMKPYTDASNKEKTRVIREEMVQEVFDSWAAFLNEYKTIDPFDFSKDPIIEQYQEEFFETFEMADADSDVKPFEIDKQIFIDKYLTTTIHKLEEKKDSKEVSEADKAIYMELIFSAVVLKESQTALTKNQTIKEITGLWAKARKYGLKFLEIMIMEVPKELAKFGFKMLAENFDNLNGST